MAFVWKQFFTTPTWFSGAVTGAGASAAGQFAKELLSFLEGKPFEVSDAAGNIFAASFGGFVVGGMLAPIKIIFEKPVPQWIHINNAGRIAPSVVVLEYSNIQTVTTTAGMLMVPGSSILGALIKSAINEWL